VILLAIRQMESRVASLEAQLSGGNGGNRNNLDQRFAEAQQKSAAMAKEPYIDKVEKLALNREADTAEDGHDNSESAGSDPSAKDDRGKAGLGKFDRSVGSQARKRQHSILWAT
jgi:hypothetical protein